MINENQTLQTAYMYSDITPIIPNINLETLKQVEEKLKKYTSGYSPTGLNREELEQFLDWVTYNARSYAVRNIPISRDIAITSEPMTGQCAPTQNINVKLLRKLGLNVYPFNTGNCIDATFIPMSPKDKERMQNGWSSTAVRHSVAIVTLPILMQDGNVQECDFLLDPTFRQFCLNNNNQKNLFQDENWLSHGHVAPHPAYFMEENLCKELIRKGYVWLNPERAKLYGDAFKYASVREEYQNQIKKTSGKKYLDIFKRTPMQLIENKKDEEKYTQLPSEIEQKQRINFLKRLLDKLFRKSAPSLELPSASITSSNRNLREELRYSTTELFTPPSNLTYMPEILVERTGRTE